MGGGWCGQRDQALPPCTPRLTGGPHLEFIASRRRKEEGGASRELGPEAAALPASLLSWVPNSGT